MKRATKKLPVDELLRLACIYAEQDRLGLADAYPAGSPERAEAFEFVRQLQAYRQKRWGKTKLERTLDACVPMRPSDIAKSRVCAECGGLGYTGQPDNLFNRDVKRCSRGCPVRCSVCYNPNCDNPNGQH